MLLVGFLVPAFAGMTMHWGENRRFPLSKKVNVVSWDFGFRLRGNDNAHWGENRRFPLSKKVNVVSWDFGFRLRGNDNAHWGEQEVPAFAGMTKVG
jgi:hypothetical protein